MIEGSASTILTVALMAFFALLFKFLYGWHKQAVFNGVVRRKVLFAGEYVE
jgi:hypothetical protein